MAKEGGVRWILEGDSNTGYFHSIANGRRKCRIEFLETEGGRITKQEDLVDHIYNFYKSLFGKERGRVRMAENMWQNKGRLSEEQRAELIKPFAMKEVETAMLEM